MGFYQLKILCFMDLVRIQKCTFIMPFSSVTQNVENSPWINWKITFCDWCRGLAKKPYSRKKLVLSRVWWIITNENFYIDVRVCMWWCSIEFLILFLNELDLLWWNRVLARLMRIDIERYRSVFWSCCVVITIMVRALMLLPTDKIPVTDREFGSSEEIISPVPILKQDVSKCFGPTFICCKWLKSVFWLVAKLIVAYRLE